MYVKMLIGLFFFCLFKMILESAKMFSAQNKIHKDKGVAPTDFEQEVAQVLSPFLIS